MFSFSFSFNVVNILTCTTRYPRLIACLARRHTHTSHALAPIVVGFSTYVRVQIGKLERSGLARARDSRAGNSLHVIISIHLHERVLKIKGRDSRVERRHAHCQSSSRELTFGEQHQDQSCKCVPQQGTAHDGVLTDFRFVLMRTKPRYSSFTLTLT